MDIQATKLELIKMLMEVDKDSILQEIKEILYSEKHREKSQLTAEQKSELDKRMEKHLSGESKSYSWEEVKQKLISDYGLQS